MERWQRSISMENISGQILAAHNFKVIAGSKMFGIRLISIWIAILGGLVSLHAQSPAPSPTSGTTPERVQAISPTKSLVDQLGPTQFQEILSRFPSHSVDPTAVNKQG